MLGLLIKVHQRLLLLTVVLKLVVKPFLQLSLLRARLLGVYIKDHLAQIGSLLWLLLQLLFMLLKLLLRLGHILKKFLLILYRFLLRNCLPSRIILLLNLVKFRGH